MSKLIFAAMLGFSIEGAIVVGAVLTFAIGRAGLHKLQDIQDACRDRLQPRQRPSCGVLRSDVGTFGLVR